MFRRIKSQWRNRTNQFLHKSSCASTWSAKEYESEVGLKEVSGNEREQHQASDSQTQVTTHQSRRQLLLLGPLQTREDVQ